MDLLLDDSIIQCSTPKGVCQEARWEFLQFKSVDCGRSTSILKKQDEILIYGNAIWKITIQKQDEILIYKKNKLAIW